MNENICPHGEIIESWSQSEERNLRNKPVARTRRLPKTKRKTQKPGTDLDPNIVDWSRTIAWG